MDLLDIDKRVVFFFTELDKRIDRIEQIVNNFKMTNTITTVVDTTPPPKAQAIEPT